MRGIRVCFNQQMNPSYWNKLHKIFDLGVSLNLPPLSQNKHRPNPKPKPLEDIEDISTMLRLLLLSEGEAILHTSCQGSVSTSFANLVFGFAAQDPLTETPQHHYSLQCGSSFGLPSPKYKIGSTKRYNNGP